ncbi:MAG: CRISPR system precrRNA processing endoribonuclease RAMP protein Cas6 [Pseudomonadota bacterium]
MSCQLPTTALSPMQTAPVLPVARFRLRFLPRGVLRFPDYAGSAWRGAFGHALKRSVCVTRTKSCAACLLYRTCPYPYLFETPPPADAAKMRRYAAAPHPWLIEIEGGMAPHSAPGTEVQLGLTLFGRAHTYLAYLIHAFANAAQQGLGTGRTALTLVAVEQADDPAVAVWREIYRPGGTLAAVAPRVLSAPPMPAAVLITFHTPLRLRRAERYVRPEQFQFSDLFGNLLRRISMLTYFHTDTPLETDFAGLTQQARAVSFSRANLQWQDWTRYSARQHTTLEMGGVMGAVELDMRDLAPFWPYFWLGQYTHAGKGTVMGLGHYSLTAIDKLAGEDTARNVDHTCASNETCEV